MLSSGYYKETALAARTADLARPDQFVSAAGQGAGRPAGAMTETQTASSPTTPWGEQTACRNWKASWLIGLKAISAKAAKMIGHYEV